MAARGGNLILMPEGGREWATSSASAGNAQILLMKREASVIICRKRGGRHRCGGDKAEKKRVAGHLLRKQIGKKEEGVAVPAHAREGKRGAH